MARFATVPYFWISVSCPGTCAFERFGFMMTLFYPQMIGKPHAIKKGMKNPQTYATVSTQDRGMGPGSAGQSGDTQGLSNREEAGPESVEELIEEGQSFEAEAISGVENAP